MHVLVGRSGIGVNKRHEGSHTVFQTVASLICGAVLVMAYAVTSNAQDSGQTSDWKKMYDDVSAQLRAAQDRKSELAGDNAKLTARVAELEKQVQAAEAELQALHHQADSFTEQTFTLRAYYMGWNAFIGENPDILPRWQEFRGRGLPWLHSGGIALFEPQWPFSVP